ncbi:MAG: hypothetical protein LBQ50_04605, partial [Planctomycetaceae bacterium]|nr:hypothetical protein [Planctomycetaceae bacterium]
MVTVIGTTGLHPRFILPSAFPDAMTILENRIISNGGDGSYRRVETYEASRSGDGSSGATYNLAGLDTNFDDWTYTFSTKNSNSIRESMTIAYFVSDDKISRLVDGSSTEKVDSETEWEDHASKNQELSGSDSVNETTGYDAYGTVHREIDNRYNITITGNFDGHIKDESHSKAVTTWDSTSWSADVTTEKKISADYTFSETEEGTSSGQYAGWMSNGSGGWSASENWDENQSSDWLTKFTQHEDYSASLNYSYTINQSGTRSNESFNEQIKGSGEIDRNSNRDDSLDKEYSFSEGSWSGYASRYIDENTQTKSDDKSSNTYDFEASRSSLNDALTPKNNVNTSRHSTKTVSGEYYRHSTFGGGGSPGGSETTTDPLHDYVPIDENHSETNSTPGFANHDSLPQLMSSLTTDGVTGGFKGNYPAASTASPPGPTKVKVDIPLINKGEPNFSNFAIPDMEAALNPPPPPQPAPTEISITSNNSSSYLDWIQTGLDVLGFAPVIGGFADIANGVIHVARGNYVEAGFSVIAVVPVYGDAVAGARKV